MAIPKLSEFSPIIEGDFEYAGCWSEVYRNQCEIDELSKLTSAMLHEHLEMVRAKRGAESAKELERAVMAVRAKLPKVDEKPSAGRAWGGYRSQWGGKGGKPAEKSPVKPAAPKVGALPF